MMRRKVDEAVMDHLGRPGSWGGRRGGSKSEDVRAAFFLKINGI